MGTNCKTPQEICDKWANILKIGSWIFTVQEVEENGDDITPDAASGIAKIHLGKYTNTSHSIEKRIIMGMLSLWARDYIKCELNLHNNHIWVIPEDNVECIADALIRLCYSYEEDV